jgi:hypothetical protein
VRAWQLYAGLGGRARVRDEQRLYERAQKLTSRVATKRGMDPYDAENQISAEARRRGPITPIPGKDI